VRGPSVLHYNEFGEGSTGDLQPHDVVETTCRC